MSTPTPAYQYGAFLGAAQRGMQEFARQLSAGFQAGYKQPTTRDPLQAREAASIRSHAQQLQLQRTLGLTFVEQYARQVRRELGLVDA